MNTDKTTQAIKQQAIDMLKDGNGLGDYGGDLHSTIYNEDYFVIGYSNADKYLNEYGTFAAIRKVMEYEKDNFGEVTTYLGSSENICNMLAYIIGEEFLNESKTLQDNWNNELTEDDIDAIISELTEVL
jgi:hypothetical protein